MKLTQSVKLGAWFLIGLTMLMALGSIWVFVRMSPAIEDIITRNEHSLQACEEMLAALALVHRSGANDESLHERFANTFEKAQNNITEKGENEVIEEIGKSYQSAFEGDYYSLERTVSAISRLGEINREAMLEADRKAKQLGNAGAWGVVFMASLVFFVGIQFIRRLSQRLVKPFEEIHAVISANLKDDQMRRCTVSPNLPHDIQIVYNELNELLDKTEL